MAHTVDPAQRLSLNCLVFGDNKVFTVKVPQTDDVSILKDEIKKKIVPHLDHVAAKDLELSQVSLHVDVSVFPRPSTWRGPGKYLPQLFQFYIAIDFLNRYRTRRWTLKDPLL